MPPPAPSSSWTKSGAAPAPTTACPSPGPWPSTSTNHPSLGAKTLFATHYHELVELADFLPRVKNFNVAVAEDKGEVIFLHKIVPGGVDKSYGIHVAQLAGLPRSVVHRAQEVLTELEDGSKQAQVKRRRKSRPPSSCLFWGRSRPSLMSWRSWTSTH